MDTVPCLFRIAKVALVLAFVCAASAGDSTRLVVRRFAANPIITPLMLPGTDGENINGPSLIRAPKWLPNRLGNYYLYFAHHRGKYIRLAYADRLEGPWKIHEPGTLRLDQARGCEDHIASPDVHVDEKNKRVRMYFHGPSNMVPVQKTYHATSKDGISFKANPEVLGNSYWRAFRWKGHWYAMGRGGQLYRSRDGVRHFERGPNPFPRSSIRSEDSNEPGCRHVAIHRTGHTLWVYYSNIGDAPEQIFRCQINIAGDWTKWKTSTPELVMKPTHDYEGAHLPLRASVGGAMKAPENSLRDPCIFVDVDKSVYLLYSVSGESGIAIAEL